MATDDMSDLDLDADWLMKKNKELGIEGFIESGETQEIRVQVEEIYSLKIETTFKKYQQEMKTYQAQNNQEQDLMMQS